MSTTLRKTMNLSTELRQFIKRLEYLGHDTSGNKERFYSLKTARAWTAWIEKAKKA